MKDILQHIHKAFENRIRLGIMSTLMVNPMVDFNHLKQLLAVTDGNLASHLSALERFEFIEVHKQFVGRKPNTRYKATDAGKKAFEEHLNALEQLIKGQQGPAA